MIDEASAKQFFQWVESYYGRYPDGQRRDMWDYIKTWDGSYLDALREELKLNVSSQYKTPPDIEAMSKLYPKVIARLDRIEEQKPKPIEYQGPEDADKVREIREAMKDAGTNMNEDGWFWKTLRFRLNRGDYGKKYRIGEMNLPDYPAKQEARV